MRCNHRVARRLVIGAIGAAGLAAMVVAGTPADVKAATYTPEHPFIAGAHPERRPQGAPVLKDYPKDAAWYERALHGVSEPYPYSLKFLEDQGAWFTPFIHPGMTPPYDIRHWHAKPETRRKRR